MLPMVVAGGLCIALSFAFGIEAFKEPGTLAAALMQIGGGSAFALMVPVLAGYIAFSIADRPGLTPGLIGGMLAVEYRFRLYWRDHCWFLAGLYGEAYQHETETAAKYGSAEANFDHSVNFQPGGRPGDDLSDW
ncbi:PTS system, fructose-specific IIBC component [Salmonella bongori]|nr:PTS system, fructose-specific IIBC component [Salmonella bongori]